MSEAKKPEISIHIPPENIETKGHSERQPAASSVHDLPQEMPTITTLLQRKRLSASAKPAEIEPHLDVRQPRELGSTATPTSVSISSLELPPAPTAASGMAVAPVAALPQPTLIEPVAVEPISIQQSEAPQVTPARRRGTRSIVRPGAARSVGAPPEFRGVLKLDSLDLKQFQKMLKAHKKHGDMKKLDCLGYFSKRFAEVAYFQVNEIGALVGVLGFGNAELVTAVRSKLITDSMMPSIFSMLSQGEYFVGSVESLRAEDKKALSELGFGATLNVGAFPMIHKKSVTGLWLCTAQNLEEISSKEIKTLKKIFADLVF